MNFTHNRLTGLVAATTMTCCAPAFAGEERNLYWGDTHLHTANFMDAYWFNNTTGTPDVAYRCAKGLPVLNSSTGVRIQIETPLDFLVVADHAEYMAILTAIPHNANVWGKAPGFLIHAVKDPKEGNLDRVQVVKGWLDSKGKTHEKVFDVAWSGDRNPGADGKLPAVGNTVNLETGAYTNDIGVAELATVWRDPEFAPAQRAFYYARVLQIPTPRYSLLDAIALQIDYRETGQSATIQERAYSSPIWYRL